jgi:cysteine desulfurase
MLTREGFVAEPIPVTRAGVVDLDKLADAIRDDTTVVAVMLVNNEIGTIQPVAEIARAVRARRAEVHIHCDAVQALGKLPIDVGALGADSVAFAAHKLHGPKGAGALWLRESARLQPLWAGGGQQRGIRSGTSNVPGIAGLGAAAALAADGMDERRARWREYAELLVTAARGSGVRIRVNGDAAERAPHVLSLGFSDVPAEPLLHILESRGVLVSAGSACSERDRKPSPVLTAIGVRPDTGTIRFSFGRQTTRDQVEAAAGILIDAVSDL